MPRGDAALGDGAPDAVAAGAGTPGVGAAGAGAPGADVEGRDAAVEVAAWSGARLHATSPTTAHDQRNAFDRLEARDMGNLRLIAAPPQAPLDPALVA